MSLNQAHHPGSSGVVLFYNERCLVFYDGCDFKLGPPLQGSHSGRVYLTSHRVIFVNGRQNSGLQSFSMPFINMKGVDIKQPVFGANKIVGRVSADFNGGWQGECEFSITFKKGGAIEFGKALIELGRRACDSKRQFRPPPPYTPPVDGAAQYYNCPPPAYAPPQTDPYYNFVPQHEAFVVPPVNSLYYVNAPPPYPGAVSESGASWNAVPSVPPQNSAGYPQTGPSNVGGNFNSCDSSMSAAHAAKAAEAARSGESNVHRGYYFREDPHTVYAEPSAPPPAYSDSPPYPTGFGEGSSQQPPSYSALNPSDSNNPVNKKNQ